MSRHGRQDEVWDDRLERAIEWLVLGAIAYGALFFGGVRATELAVMTGLVGAASVLWIVRLWVVSSHRLLLHPALLPLLGFIGFAMWRAAGADVAYAARQDLWMVVLYGVTFVIGLHNLHGQDALQRVTTFLVGLGTMLSLYAVGQYLSQSDAVLWLVRPVQYFRRAGATFVNPNHFAALMVVLLPLALAQTFLGRTKGPIRVFHGYAAAMMAAGLAVTMSRGGWLAGGTVLVTFFVWLLIRRRQMRIPALVGLATVVVGALLFLGMSSKARQRIEGVNAEGTADSGNRAPLWKPAWAMWKDHPWLGVGPGHYDVRFPQYRDHTIQTSPA
jgi:O-antigen ligase